MFALLVLLAGSAPQTPAPGRETASAIRERALASAVEEVQRSVPGGCERLERALRLFWQPTDVTEWPRVMRRPVPARLAALWRPTADECVKAALEGMLTETQRRDLLTSALLHDGQLREKAKSGVEPAIGRGGGEGPERHSSENPSTAAPELLEPGLDPELIARVLHSTRAQVQSCYEREVLARPSLAGTVDVEFRVTRAGKVADVVKVGGTLDDPTVEVCILTRMETWAFPRPKHQEPRVRYRFDLQPRPPGD